MIATLETCDQCCANARHVIYKNDLTLAFCGHHFRESANALADKGWLPRNTGESYEPTSWPDENWPDEQGNELDEWEDEFEYLKYLPPDEEPWQ